MDGTVYYYICDFYSFHNMQTAKTEKPFNDAHREWGYYEGHDYTHIITTCTQYSAGLE